MRAIGRYYRALWAGQTWSAIGYLLLGLPLGILWGVYTVTMLAVGASLVIVWIGLPILVGFVASMRGIGASERRLANGMIAAGVVRPGPRPSPEDSGGGSRLPRMWHWGVSVMHDGHAWRVAAWTFLRLIIGPIGFAIAVVAVVVPFSLLAAVVLAVGVQAGWVTGATDAQAQSVVDTVAFWVLVGSPVLLLMLPMFAWAARGTAAAHRPVARWSLGPCEPELTARAQARAELAEEQVRIDQELHDSIGHMITMNIVQAGAGAHVFDSDPEFARQALRNIEERGRAAMGELDRIIAHLRGDAPARAPLPTIADIPALVDASRRAGSEVEVTLDAPVVPDAVGRAVFGIVREALTNAAKFAPGSHVEVVVAGAGDAVGVSIVNGPARSTDTPLERTSGRGLAGIRDRVALLGGRAHSGPEGEGFAVRALIPLGAALSRDEQPSGVPDAWSDLREKVAP